MLLVTPYDLLAGCMVKPVDMFVVLYVPFISCMVQCSNRFVMLSGGNCLT